MAASSSVAFSTQRFGTPYSASKQGSIVMGHKGFTEPPNYSGQALVIISDMSNVKKGGGNLM